MTLVEALINIAIGVFIGFILMGAYLGGEHND